MSGWDDGPTQVESGNAIGHGGGYGYDDQNGPPQDDKCFSCGEEGHRKFDCPNAAPMTCRYCKEPGHMAKECPRKPPMSCDNCGEEGHLRKDCTNARKIDRSGVADMAAELAWDMIKRAAAEQDANDAKEGIQAYVKALNGGITFRELQEAFIHDKINIWLIATERSLIEIFTNMDLQGNMGKKYTVTYRFSEKPQRPRDIEGWPKSVDEILARLDDAGDVVDTGKPKCSNCDELGHTAKQCTQEKVVREAKGLSCYNCGADGHRIRDCTEPRKDRFACRNCGKSGHKSVDCEEEPNLDNVTCRKCEETGHFAKDCPKGGGRGCRNCGQEGHFAADCDQPPNLDNVQCRNCEKTGHFSRDCPEPKDWSKVKCSNCQEFGHTKVRCKQLPAEQSENDSGGHFDGNTGDSGGVGWDNGGGQPKDNGGDGSWDNGSNQSQNYGGGGVDAW
ncbi:ATP-dependent RNA helicase glh-4 [Beauveria bassiana D1-5]|uniref:ATP-dependent RNA helicase glh-4 n=1 Tax=Beauveria bassiana D1-5 TaxID=1245745 RepID=A0A0A2VBJ5_BEABA|nr:ATP-dependent RNA helicase glh-4 [Beauveria bassiana D1-5]